MRPDKNAANCGQKYDDGKLRTDLIPPEVKYALAKVLTYGAQKYAGTDASDSGWRRVPDAIRRYRAARDRHLLSQELGEVCDPESGLPHSWHALCNQAFIVCLEAGQDEAKALRDMFKLPANPLGKEAGCK